MGGRKEIAYIRIWMFCTTLIIYICFAVEENFSDMETF